MEKTIFLAIALSAFFLTGCTTTSQSTIINNNTEKVSENKSAQSKQNNTTNEINEITKKTEDGFLIPEVGIKIIFPEEYMITKDNEKSRRGSFASYEFSYKAPLPTFQEIQFFSEESIKQFTANCDVDSPCFFGDYPDLNRYIGQKNAFKSGEDYKKYELKKFGDCDYFVSNFKCTGDSCVIREYTTFIDDTKIDVWITMMDDTQVGAADDLFEKFEILE